MRELLMERRARVLESMDSGINNLSGGEGHHIADMEELAADSAEDATAYRILEIENAELEQVEHALQKLAEGSYGECEECGERISSKRLEAIPFATMCIDCKREFESSSRDDD